MEKKDKEIIWLALAIIFIMAAIIGYFLGSNLANLTK